MTFALSRRPLAGNARFVAGQQIHPHPQLAWRKTLLNGQQPFACVLGCADSRVSPELVFDHGRGPITGAVNTVARAIEATVRATPGNSGDAPAFLAACVRNQAKRVRAELLERSAAIERAARDRQVDILSAAYDLGSGRVEQLE